MLTEKELLGFCSACYAPIYTFSVGENPYDYGESSYDCEECGEHFTNIIEPSYCIGDIVEWHDPCRNNAESDSDYDERCSQPRTINSILRCDDCTCDYIVYELDNGTEVYEKDLCLI